MEISPRITAGLFSATEVGGVENSQLHRRAAQRRFLIMQFLRCCVCSPRTGEWMLNEAERALHFELGSTSNGTVRFTVLCMGLKILLIISMDKISDEILKEVLLNGPSIKGNFVFQLICCEKRTTNAGTFSPNF